MKENLFDVEDLAHPDGVRASTVVTTSGAVTALWWWTHGGGLIGGANGHCKADCII